MLIADADPAERRALGWALRDRFAVIDELEREHELARALQLAGPFEELYESTRSGWRLLAMICGEAHNLTVVACRDDRLAALVRRCVPQW